ncbi:TPA: gamma-glutamyltranspeptidase [Escherichia coli]|nr:gamma-glutamyltranspeptidase [Escherichia coli]HBH9535317.1 gamma-glutamyltranspeptidase [Escherichia coli]
MTVRHQTGSNAGGFRAHFSAVTLKLLEAKGQKVALNEAMGSTQSIMVGSDGELYGASDSRLVDDLTAGY